MARRLEFPDEQRAALQGFWRAEDERARLEAAEMERGRVEEGEAEAAARAARAQAEGRLAEARASRDFARQALDQVALGRLWRGAVFLPERAVPAGAQAAAELDRVVGRARQAAAAVAAGVARLQAWRRTKQVPRLVLALGTVAAFLGLMDVVASALVALLLAPLALALAIALFRLDLAVSLAGRLRDWALRPARPAPAAARPRRSPLKSGTAWIVRWCDGISNPFVRAAVQTGGFLYFLYLCVYLAVTAILVMLGLAVAAFLIWLFFRLLTEGLKGE